MEKLSGNYVAGFVDGEGCFAFSLRRDVRHERGKRSGIKPVYFYWKAQFVIVLREDDKPLLEKIKQSLNCGLISSTRNQTRYQVSDLDELRNKIIPFFLKHQLHGKKKNDFLLWIEAVNILYKYKIQRGKVNIRSGERGFHKISWGQEDLEKLIGIHQKISIYKSDGQKRKWLNKANDIGRV